MKRKGQMNLPSCATGIFAPRANAVEVISGVEPGASVCVVTLGEKFSLGDLLDAALDVTGPAEVSISSWCIALKQIGALKMMVDSGRITRLRLLLDRSFKSRQPKYADQLERSLAGRYRTGHIHAKWLAIVGASDALAVRSSASLNQNPRTEVFDITRDIEFSLWLAGLTDVIWDEAVEGFKTSRESDLMVDRLMEKGCDRASPERNREGLRLRF